MNKMVRENIVTKLERGGARGGGGRGMKELSDQMGWERVRKLV